MPENRTQLPGVTIPCRNHFGLQHHSWRERKESNPLCSALEAVTFPKVEPALLMTHLLVSSPVTPMRRHHYLTKQVRNADIMLPSVSQLYCTILVKCLHCWPLCATSTYPTPILGTWVRDPYNPGHEVRVRPPRSLRNDRL